jgi:hypothetical protein
LVQNNSQQATQQLAKGKVNQNNVQRVQDAVVGSLNQDIKSTLGQDYFKNIKFNLTTVTLPRRVQDAIDRAQSAFAQVSQAQARIRQADADAKANESRQRGYKACPACAQIDTLKAIPPNCDYVCSGAQDSLLRVSRRYEVYSSCILHGNTIASSAYAAYSWYVSSIS